MSHYVKFLGRSGEPITFAFDLKAGNCQVRCCKCQSQVLMEFDRRDTSIEFIVPLVGDMVMDHLGAHGFEPLVLEVVA